MSQTIFHKTAIESGECFQYFLNIDIQISFLIDVKLFENDTKSDLIYTSLLNYHSCSNTSFQPLITVCVGYTHHANTKAIPGCDDKR